MCHAIRRTTPADSNEASEEEDASEQSESEIDESDLDRVEKILDVREDKDGKEKFFVKFKGAPMQHWSLCFET